MFARVKKSRGQKYLQIVENYRDDGRTRQRMILYVGDYLSVTEALERMPGDLRYARSRATRARKEYERVAGANLGEASERRSERAAESTRKEAEARADRLDRLKQLVSEHPNLRGDQREVS